MYFEAIAYDEMTGKIDNVTVKASSLESALDMIEGNEDHEYEVIEIEMVNQWNVK